MLDIEVYEVRYRQYIVKRKASIPASQLSELTTFIYTQGGVEEKTNEFWLPSPRLEYVVKHLENALNIKFQEVKR